MLTASYRGHEGVRFVSVEPLFTQAVRLPPAMKNSTECVESTLSKTDVSPYVEPPDPPLAARFT